MPWCFVHDCIHPQRNASAPKEPDTQCTRSEEGLCMSDPHTYGSVRKVNGFLMSKTAPSIACYCHTTLQD